MLELEKMDIHIESVMELIKKYQSGISSGRVLPKASRREMEDLLFEEMPIQGKDAEAVIEEFADKIIPNSTKVGSARFLSWIITSPSQAGILGEMANIGLSQAPFLFKAGPAATVIEDMIINWIKGIFDFPEGAGGILVSGGSVSTLTALGAAREAMFPGVTENGMHSLEKPLALYTSKKAHASIDKAIGALGFGKKMLRKIGVDSQYRIDPKELEESIIKDRQNGCMPFCIIAQAGTSVAGAVDDIQRLSEIAKKYGLWLHVDGAYGGGAILTTKGKELLRGIQEADSISVDPHKWFFIPPEAGCVLLKDRRHLYNAYRMGQDEYNPKTPVEFVNYGIQSTRMSRAIKIWFAFKIYGTQTLAAAIEKNIELAKAFHEGLADIKGVSRLNNPMTSAVCFSFEGGQEENEGFLRYIEEEFFLSPAVLGGKHCIRACFSNYRTKKGHVEELLELIREFKRS
ncbi:L-2,4-diaminobutyrate decarboxylase Ddc [Peptoclostridium acidaminophilum DSM 3953]|uniref:L-2,4-diaminobutyrate decarboxylase Ddc n=1 Tax=Peptoclostridium acidaminophilum DSM 3953 TaxID=1286171 RepID=W8U814_PEPAC|nr:pyridoxal-dependent decarboxylase [Peptoclostridium acidaminophilum]AHM57021.1 L-2,4-diaminobutyrate decarboxylase Ddc [Peptoclostridium acidaminophilum DSM 3953]